MRIKLIFGVLAVALASLAGCGDRNDDSVSYTNVYVVENQTDKDVFLQRLNFGGYYGLQEATVAPGESKIVGTNQFGSSDSQEPAKDYLRPDDYVFHVFFLPGVDYEFPTITVGDEVISSDEVWKRKYWSFTGAIRECKYTLTITDALLAEVAAAEQ